MKKFQFRLQGLLKLKQSLEKEVRRQLAEAQALCRQKELEIQSTENKVKEWSEYYNKVLTTRVNATELASIDTHLQNLYRFKEQLLISLEILNRKKADLVTYYQEVRKEVKMLDHLKEKKRDEYHEELRKEEEKIADEMASLRYARERVCL